MSIRLNKATRNLNQSMTVLTGYLNEMGYNIETNPNTKLTEQQYSLLVEHFNEGKISANSDETSNSVDDKRETNDTSLLQFEFNQFKQAIAGLNIIEQIRSINTISSPLRIKVSGSYLFKHITKSRDKEIIEIINKIPENLISEVISVKSKPILKADIIKHYTYLIYLIQNLLYSHLLIKIESYYFSFEPKDYKSELLEIKEFEVLCKIFDFNFSDLFHRIYLQFVGQLVKNITYTYTEFTDKIHFAQSISHNTRSEYLLEYLGRNKGSSLFVEYISMNFDKIHFSQRLRLWLYDIYGEFNYEMFYPYFFILSIAEKKILKKKARIFMKNMVWTDIQHSREPWIFVSSSLDNNKTFSIYHATWKSIWFDEKAISICIDDKPTFSKPYNWDFSEEKFNLIIGSLSGKRIKPLTVHVVEDQIIKIDGLQDVEEAIWKILLKIDFEKGSDNNQTFLKNLSNISNLPENILAKNKGVELLSRYQASHIPIVLVVKLSSTLKEIEQSLLSCIQINMYEYAVVWESLEYEKSKRTHIFKCENNEIDDFVSYIKTFILSEPYLRSRLNSDKSEDDDFRIKLKYLTGINHDNSSFDNWESRFYQLFPELNR